MTTTVWQPPRAIPAMTSTDTAAAVVVIGAGIVGMSLATMLGERGVDVLVLSRHDLGDSVTGRSSAKVTALHQSVYADLEQRHGLSTATAYATAASDAVAWVRNRAGGGATTRDAMTVARDEDERDQLEQELDAALRAGLDVVLDDDVHVWPGAVGGIRLPDQLQVDPVALLATLADDLPTNVRLRRATVTSVRERPGQVRVGGDGWSVVARHVVVATGLPILDRSGMFALCEPQASHIVAIEQDPSHRPDTQEMMIGVGNPTRSVRWTDGLHGPVLLAGGGDHRPGDHGPTSANTARIESWARRTFPGLGRTVASWGALDYHSPDLLPYAGPHLRVGGPVHVVTGLRKWGMTLGVACAAALTDRLTDGIVTPFGHVVDTARLPDGRGLATIASNQATVGRHMVTGWARALTASDDGPTSDLARVARDGRHVSATTETAGGCAVSGVCTHLGGVVAYNDVDDTWDCPLHGSRFRSDGAVHHGPAVRDLKRR